jgi:hypothetical protein
VVIDGCCKRGNLICARIGCEVVSSDFSGEMIFTNCSKRPLDKSIYCCQHYIENQKCSVHREQQKCVFKKEIVDQKSLLVNGEILLEYRFSDGQWVSYQLVSK